MIPFQGGGERRGITLKRIFFRDSKGRENKKNKKNKKNLKRITKNIVIIKSITIITHSP